MSADGKTSYKGCLKDGKKHGFGELTSTNDRHKYSIKGYWSHGQMHGKVEISVYDLTRGSKPI